MSKSRTKRRRQPKHGFKLKDTLESDDFNTLNRGIIDTGMAKDGCPLLKTANLVFSAFLLATKIARLEEVHPIPVQDSVTREGRTKFAFVFSYNGKKSMEEVWGSFLNGETLVEPQVFNQKLRALRSAMYKDVQVRKYGDNDDG